MNDPSSIIKVVRARLPVEVGEFHAEIYNGADGKEHVVLTIGHLDRHRPALVRVHSECFTGDVLGSRRCDCGDQLAESLRRIAAEGCGVLLYLRQEGRGIGLADKLRAYNLQDLGYDTVDANTQLGHAPDKRDYGVAAGILRDLGVVAVRLLTNNPAKVAGLSAHGIAVVDRIPLVTPVQPENRGYLRAKAERMGHLLALDGGEVQAPPTSVRAPAPPPGYAGEHDLFERLGRAELPLQRPFVTLSYAQSLDGSSAAVSDRPLAISNEHSLRFTHRLRAAHDAILVGIGTVLADDPRLTVRGVAGADPQPVVLDSRLRFPLDARLLGHPNRRVWIATTRQANPERVRRLEALGAEVLLLPDNQGRVDLVALFAALRARGVERLMVEGGGRVITQVLGQRLLDLLVLTVAPIMVGGVRAVTALPGLSMQEHARIDRPGYLPLGGDMVVWGTPCWLRDGGQP